MATFPFSTIPACEACRASPGILEACIAALQCSFQSYFAWEWFLVCSRSESVSRALLGPGSVCSSGSVLVPCLHEQ
eukprot:scaffold295156_cov39-Tisochrysis_lutea.AAC.1